MGVDENIKKIDGLGLMLGRPAYTADLMPDQALHVKILRSPHAHAKILSIDTSKAKAMADIKLVLTYEDLKDHTFSRAGQGFPEPSPYDKKILSSKVRYIGDAVCILAGTEEKALEAAMKSIDVKYEILEPITDFEKALDHDIIIHDEGNTSSMFPIGHDPTRNLAAQYEMEIGSVADSLESCDVIHKGIYYTQGQAHCMLETHSAGAYYDVNNRLNIITSTQTPFHVRRIVAKAIDLPISKIRVVKPRIGGGYGGKQAIHGEIYVALVTKLTGQASTLIYSRKEVFEATYRRHPMRIEMTLGANKEGYIKAIDMNILSNTGAYGEHALTVLMVAGSKSLPLYNKVEAVGFRGDVVYTNTTPAGAFRGYGAIQGNFALESSIDELAKKLDMDPIEIRRKNMIKENETSKIFEVMGEGTEGVKMMIESCKLEACLDWVLNAMDYKNKYPKRMVSKDKVRGVGLALAMQGSGIPYIDMGAAILKLNDDGFFNLMVGATDLGTGSDTILAQMAAEVLNVAIDDLSVYASDTDLTPFDTGAYASSTTYVSGHSVRIAAENMKKNIIEKAKKVLKCDHVDFDGKHIITPDQTYDFKKFSTELLYSNHQEQLVAYGSYVGVKSPPPYMVGGCEVEVDLRTDDIKVLNYYAAVDCGTTINPNLAKIQVEGALVQGIGMTLYEEAKDMKSGKLYNNSFLSYKVPTRMDIGPIHVHFVKSYEPSGPFGAKSVGEIGIDTPPAAIANAVYNATGKRIRTLPIDLSKYVK